MAEKDYYRENQFERRRTDYPEIAELAEEEGSYSISSLSFLLEKHEEDMNEARYWKGFDLKAEADEWLKYNIPKPQEIKEKIREFKREEDKYMLIKDLYMRRIMDSYQSISHREHDYGDIHEHIGAYEIDEETGEYKRILDFSNTFDEDFD